MKKTIKCEKTIHEGYKEWERAKEEGSEIPQLFGKYHYFYSSKKGKISLIELKNYFKQGDDFWEIYSLKGNLFEDTERFPTKKQAEKRVEELLNY